MTMRPITFDGFRFDAVTGELRGPQGVVRLGPQPAKLLAILVERPGVLISRDELKVALWPDTVVEADQGLNSCVLQLRSALGDDAGNSRYIETLPRRGYRFIASIDGASPSAVNVAMPTVAFDNGVELPAADRATVSDASPNIRPGMSLPRVFGLTILGFVALASAWAFASAVRGANQNLAIMPMTAQSGDPAWIDGVNTEISDLLITKLTAAAPGKIGVIGPLTTRAFTGDSISVKQLGAALKVGYVLSATARSSDSTLFVQVVRVSDGVHVCAFRRQIVGVNADSLISPLATAIADGILNDVPRPAATFGCGK